MQKLAKGKTFTEKYKFKRLLKTDPSVLRKYKTQEEYIQSIPAVKDQPLYETDSVLPFPVPGDVTAPSQTIEVIRRGSRDWPHRVEFAEQIPDITKNGGYVWAVNLHYSTGIEAHKGSIVLIKRMRYPIITLTTSQQGTWPMYTVVDIKDLPTLDSDDSAFFYLCDTEELTRQPALEAHESPWDVWACGIVPNPMTPFNATFYNREVAHLYAESLRAQTRYITDVYYRRK